MWHMVVSRLRTAHKPRGTEHIVRSINRIAACHRHGQGGCVTGNQGQAKHSEEEEVTQEPTRARGLVSDECTACPSQPKAHMGRSTFGEALWLGLWGCAGWGLEVKLALVLAMGCPCRVPAMSRVQKMPASV